MRAISLPVEAMLIAPREALQFLHVGEVELARPLTALEVWQRSTADELPLLPLAFRVRDGISGLFGVAPINGLKAAPPDEVRVGDKLAFFTVDAVRDDLLALTVRDWHLDVMACITTEGRRVQVTASVRVKNLFGHLYMLPVGPAHRLIVWSMLRRLKRAVAAEDLPGPDIGA